MTGETSTLQSLTLPTELVSGQMGEQTAQACNKAWLHQLYPLGGYLGFVC